jgi:hypothetical protein
VTDRLHHLVERLRGLLAGLPRATGRVGVVPAAVLLVASLLLVAAVRGPVLPLRADARFAVTAPLELERTAAPLTISWTVDAETAELVQQRERFFAVFLDRPPIAPGQSLSSLSDDECRRTDGCPDATWLADRRVFLSMATEVTIPVLRPQAQGGRGGRTEVHEATVVIVNAGGYRLDERAATVRFRTGTAPDPEAAG